MVSQSNALANIYPNPHSINPAMRTTKILGMSTTKTMPGYNAKRNYSQSSIQYKVKISPA